MDVQVVYGAPGTNTWAGGLVGRAGDDGWVLGLLGPPADRNEYAGYSLAVGKFLPGKSGLQTAVAAPRAGPLQAGRVSLVAALGPDQPDAPGGPQVRGLHLHQLLEGDQLGEYFGGAVLAVDLTGDGLADLVVGSPLATQASAGARTKRSTGRFAKVIFFCLYEIFNEFLLYKQLSDHVRF